MKRSEQCSKAQDHLRDFLLSLIGLRMYAESQVVAQIGMRVQAEEKRALAEEKSDEEFTMNSLGEGI